LQMPLTIAQIRAAWLHYISVNIFTPLWRSATHSGLKYEVSAITGIYRNIEICAIQHYYLTSSAP